MAGSHKVDVNAQPVIDALQRIAAGNRGKHRNLKGGVTELKMPTGSAIGFTTPTAARR